MRILMVSYWFPPYNSIGAVRVGKNAKYLVACGHDVRVLTAIGQTALPVLNVELDHDRIIYTKWFDRMHLKYVTKHPSIMPEASLHSKSATKHSKLYAALRLLYTNIVAYPDVQIGWYSTAVQEGINLCKEWSPDIIYASALPYTSLLVAKQMSDTLHVPWVAELRDLWTDNTYHPRYAIRTAFEKRLEKHVLHSALGIVTVSNHLVQTLKKNNSQPIKCIMNGFDEEDYPAQEPDYGPSEKLRIGYFGNLYPVHGDPGPLFNAIADMQEKNNNIEVSFYGRNVSSALKFANKYGVFGNISVHNEISFAESITAQRNSDILLLLLRDGPEDKGILSGKLFEYIGTRRPILCVGCDHGEAAELVTRLNAGFVSSDNLAIKQKLTFWLDEKQTKGCVSSPPETCNHGLTRKDQASALSDFLTELLPKPATTYDNRMMS